MDGCLNGMEKQLNNEFKFINNTLDEKHMVNNKSREKTEFIPGIYNSVLSDTLPGLLRKDELISEMIDDVREMKKDMENIKKDMDSLKDILDSIRNNLETKENKRTSFG